jgi:hypothetical protein
MDRRAFLHRVLLASGATLAWPLVGCSSPGGWGTPPDARARDLLLPEARRPRRTLEVFLWGGLSPWDTLCCVPAHGRAGGGGAHAGERWMWWAHQAETEQHLGTCGLDLSALTEPFAEDAAGELVHLGPFAAPLRGRSDIVERLRVVVMEHDQFPHQTAVPLALSGNRLGAPRMAGTASHVERWIRETEPDRLTPAAWVIQPPNPAFRTDNTPAAAAVGRHPGFARPGVLRIGESTLRQVERFSRAHLDGRDAAFDQAADAYGAAFEAALRPAGAQAPLRSQALDDWRAAQAGLREAPAIAGLLDDALEPAPATSCGEEGSLDGTAGGLRAAVRMLTSPISDARWATVIDGGLIPASHMTGFDTHIDHVRVQARNTLHTLRTLVELINEPDEGDPDKLDLAHDTVLLTTEFGRSPYPETGSGLDHWNAGYAVAAFGGWADAARSGVVGAIDVEGRAVQGVRPAELRAALLLAQGIWPFEPEAFATSDVRGADDRIAAAQHLRQHVLGYGS